MAKSKKKTVKKMYGHRRAKPQNHVVPGTHISSYDETCELPCLVCGKELRAQGIGNCNCWSQVNGDNIAHMAGNYGSTVYDPPGQYEYLRFAVCDSCLLSRSARIQFVKWSQPLPVIETLQTLSEQLIEEEISPTELALKNMASEAEDDLDDQTD